MSNSFELAKECIEFEQKNVRIAVAALVTICATCDRLNAEIARLAIEKIESNYESFKFKLEKEGAK